MADFSIDARKAKFIHKDVLIKKGTRLQFLVSQESSMLEYSIPLTYLGLCEKVNNNTLEQIILFRNTDETGSYVKPGDITKVRGLMEYLKFINNELVFYKDKSYIAPLYETENGMRMYLLWTWEE